MKKIIFVLILLFFGLSGCADTRDGSLRMVGRTVGTQQAYESEQTEPQQATEQTEIAVIDFALSNSEQATSESESDQKLSDTVESTPESEGIPAVQPDTAEKQEQPENYESARHSEEELQSMSEQPSTILQDPTSDPAGTVLKSAGPDAENLFFSQSIQPGDDVYQRIWGRSYVENPDIALEDLRYCRLLHYNFNHNVQIGELIVAADLAEEVLDLFLQLYRAEYEIYSMYLIDNFWSGNAEDSDTASCEANNTSCFCYRRASGTDNLSRHALGRAIDINPQQNPYVSYTSGSPVWYHDNADDFINRDSGLPHMITHEDPAFSVFSAVGWTWGGDWYTPRDYQHFQK